MIVAELMTPNPVTVAPSDSLELAYEKMKAGHFRQVPVMDQGKLIGILTDRDIRQYLGQLAHTSVEAVMSALPFSVRPSTPVEQAAHLLATNKVGSLPVIENDKLVRFEVSSHECRGSHERTAIFGTAFYSRRASRSPASDEQGGQPPGHRE